MFWFALKRSVCLSELVNAEIGAGFHDVWWVRVRRFPYCCKGRTRPGTGIGLGKGNSPVVEFDRGLGGFDRFLWG